MIARMDKRTETLVRMAQDDVRRLGQDEPFRSNMLKAKTKAQAKGMIVISTPTGGIQWVQGVSHNG